MEARDGGSGHTSEQAGQDSAAAARAVLAILPELPMQDRFLLTLASRTDVPGPHQEARPPTGPHLRPSQATAPAETDPRTPKPGSSEAAA